MKSRTDVTSNNILQKAIFIVLLLFSIHFWELKYIPQKITIENILTYLACGFCLVMVIQKDGMRFKNAILVFLAGIVLNCFAAFINLGQSPIRTLLSFEYYYFILFYFMLHYFNINRKFLENIVIIFGIIYSMLYLFQYRVYPYLIIFRHDPNTAEWSWQFEILGHGFLMLAYFLVLNKFLLTRKLIDIFLALGFLMVLFKSDFRTLIAGAGVITVLMVFRTVHKVRDIITIVFVGLMFIGFTQYRGIAKAIDRMVTKTQEDIKEGNKYVRLVELEFFYKKFPQNISYFIIGSGRPSGENLYKVNRGALGLNYNIVWVDIGILGFYIVLGGITTLGLLWYTFKAIFIKLPRDKLYLNFYFLYLFIVSFTNEEIYRNGIFSVQAIGLYLIDIAVNEKSKSEDETTVKEIHFSDKR